MPNKIAMARKVESMSKAVEAITSENMSAPEAASYYGVSEIDLIHLSQTCSTDYKLTDDEERAVVLCCMRLSRMGFSVTMSTLMSKCQEMFARRYSTDVIIPISDKYCKDLFYRNLPQLTPTNDVKSSETLQSRLANHFKTVRKLHNSFKPRSSLSTSQVLIFDVKTYVLVKDSLKVNFSLLSTMSTSRHFLPVMLIQPTYSESKNAYLTAAIAKHGIPTTTLVYHYITNVLSRVQERPVIIMCNGHASLLSEKLISSCVSDSVHFHCVSPDISPYVFPSFHGGLDYLLQKQIPAQYGTVNQFEECLYDLLMSRDKVTQSIKHALAATGIFPFNSSAPIQFQNLNLNARPNKQNILSLNTESTEIRTKENDTVEVESETEIIYDSDASKSNLSDCDKSRGSANNIESRKRKFTQMQESKTTMPQNDSKLSALVEKHSAHPSLTQQLARSLIHRAKKFQRDYVISQTQRSNNPNINSQANRPVHESNGESADRSGQVEIVRKRTSSHAPSFIMNKKSSIVNQSLVSISRKLAVRKSAGERLILPNIDSKKSSKTVKSKLEDFIDKRRKHSRDIEESINHVIAESKAQWDAMSTNDDLTSTSLGFKDKKLKRKHPPDLDQKKMRRSCFQPLPTHEFTDGSTENINQSTDVSLSSEFINQSTESCNGAIRENGDFEKNDDSISNEDTLQQGALENKASSSKDSNKTEFIAMAEQRGAKEFLGKDKMERQTYEGMEHTRNQNEEKGKEIDTDHEESIGDEKGSQDKLTSHTLDNGVIDTHKKKRKKEKRKRREKAAQIDNDVEKDREEKREENVTSSPIKKKHKSEKKKKRKKKKKERVASSENLEEEAKHPIEDGSVNEKEEVLKSDIEEHQGIKLVRLRRLSLMDHDYFKRSEDSSELTANIEEKLEENSEITLRFGSTIPSENNKEDSQDSSLNEHGYSKANDYDLEEAGAVMEDEGKNVTVTTEQETVVEADSDGTTDSDSDSDSSSSSNSSSDSESGNGNSSSESQADGEKKSDGSRSGLRDKSSESNSSDSSEDESGSASPQKTAEPSTKTQSKESDSTSGSQVSDEEEGGVSGESDDDEEGESDVKKESESDDDEEEHSTSISGDEEDFEDEDEEEDDSKCQMCMRATPPHSKDMIIDWVDCDGNCGRWFHVICIHRSKSKADPKHFVCPSCSCKR